MSGARFTGFLLLAGVGVVALGQGDLNSINLQNLNLAEIERYLSTIDLGPLNGMLADMKEAAATIKKTVIDLMNSAPKS